LQGLRYYSELPLDIFCLDLNGVNVLLEPPLLPYELIAKRTLASNFRRVIAFNLVAAQFLFVFNFCQLHFEAAYIRVETANLGTDAGTRKPVERL
jgi:hypothetical protein